MTDDTPPERKKPGDTRPGKSPEPGKSPQEPRIPPPDKEVHETKRYEAKDLPTQETIEEALRHLITYAARKKWILESGPVLTNLRIVRKEVDEDASQKEFALAVREYLENAVQRVKSSKNRVILEVVLGLGKKRWKEKSWRHEPVSVRRKEAGRHVRADAPATASTIRTYYEPRAIQDLAKVILADERKARGRSAGSAHD
jgi:hypothetical protein